MTSPVPVPHRRQVSSRLSLCLSWLRKGTSCRPGSSQEACSLKEQNRSRFPKHERRQDGLERRGGRARFKQAEQCGSQQSLCLMQAKSPSFSGGAGKVPCSSRAEPRARALRCAGRLKGPRSAPWLLCLPALPAGVWPAH